MWSALARLLQALITLVALIVASVRSRRALGRATSELPSSEDRPPAANPAASTHVSLE